MSCVMRLRTRSWRFLGICMDEQDGQDVGVWLGVGGVVGGLGASAQPRAYPCDLASLIASPFVPKGDRRVCWYGLRGVCRIFLVGGDARVPPVPWDISPAERGKPEVVLSPRCGFLDGIHPDGQLLPSLPDRGPG